jgi:Flp pilus assembly protein TadG
VASRLWQWLRNSQGGIAVTFALALPVLFGVVGVATDYAMLTKLRAELQEAADSAAMAGAREIPLAMSKASQVESAVRSYAAYRLTQNSAASDLNLSAMDLTLDIHVVDDFSAVNVTIQQAWKPFFMHFVNSAVTPVTVTSRARFVGRNNICVLALASKNTGVLLDQSSRLAANNCGIFTNSSDSAGLRIDTGATVSATILCSAGGATVSGAASVKPAPMTDCPAVQDPLASRSGPTVGSCDFTNLVVNGASETLDPGVYCGGITIKGSAKVSLNPGVYVLKGGGLSVVGMASLSGEGVGFFLTGTGATPTLFGATSSISLSAPKDGPMAGLLMFEDRDLAVKLRHRITSDNARKLLGTIYLPVGSLLIDAKKPVADQSAYTAIVAQAVELNMGPNLILNSDYDMTDVPVPAGIAGSSQVVLQN